MSTPVIKLGLVGAIAETAMSVLNALLRQPRLQLTDVYDPCLAKAQENAQHLDTSFSPSLDGLLRRAQGIVVGDVKWLGLEPILLAAEFQLPTLILRPVLSQLSDEDLETLRSKSQEARALIVPELSHRWTRSTLRLRELTATQLGAIEEIDLICNSVPGSHAELMVFDWCTNVMQSECRSVEVQPETGALLLKYRRLNREGKPVFARIQFEATQSSTDFPVTSARITCRHGNVVIAGEEKLDWEIDRRKVSEALHSDRGASDVMFDLFGRRLVGGIVPIPEIGDVLKMHQIRRACEKSRTDCAETAL